MEDQDLVWILEQCLTGGGASRWEKFIELAQPVVASSIFRALSRTSSVARDLADDLIQDTFVRLFDRDFRILRNLRSGDANGLRAYLRSVASSVAIDYLRSLSPGTEPLDDAAGKVAANDRIHQRLEGKMLRSQVEKCLQHEQDRERYLFWLYYRDGMKPKDIAKVPGIAMGMSGIETALYRLTKKVRDCVRKSGFLEPAKFSGGERV